MVPLPRSAQSGPLACCKWSFTQSLASRQGRDCKSRFGWRNRGIYCILQVLDQFL